jgi:hypothetical protein
MISLAGVDDERRKPQVSQPGLPKSNIRRKPEVTPRAALEDAAYRSNPAGYIGWDDWTHNIWRKPAGYEASVAGGYGNWRKPAIARQQGRRRAQSAQAGCTLLSPTGGRNAG